MPYDIESFIDETLHIQDADELLHYFDKRMRNFGLLNMAYIYVISNFKRCPVDKRLVYSTFPDHWTDAFINDDIFIPSLISQPSIEHGRPIFWRDLVEKVNLSADEKLIVQGFFENDYSDGVSFPVFARPGDAACILFHAPTESFERLEDYWFDALTICQHVHSRLVEIRTKDQTPTLTPRETEVLELISQGASNKAISEQLGLSPHTVDTIIRRCFAKLGVSTRVDAVLSSIAKGVILY